MDDVTMARLLAKHALGLEEYVHDGQSEPEAFPIFEVDDDIGVVIYRDWEAWDDNSPDQNWDPANVTDHAIEAVRAMAYGYRLQRTRQRQEYAAARCGDPMWVLGAWASAADELDARALSLALIRALGVEEEPTDAAD